MVLLNPPCDEDWSCTDWSDCADSQQSRTCTDSNVCETEIEMPEELQDCDSTAPSPVINLEAI